MLEETERAKPGPEKKDRSHDVTEPPTLSDLGLTKRESAEAQMLARTDLLKPTIEEQAKEQQIRKPKSVSHKCDEQAMRTDEEIAKLAGVSRGTVRKSEIIEKEATEEKERERSSDLTKSTKSSKPIEK